VPDGIFDDLDQVLMIYVPEDKQMCQVVDEEPVATVDGVELDEEEKNMLVQIVACLSVGQPRNLDVGITRWINEHAVSTCHFTKNDVQFLRAFYHAHRIKKLYWGN
jgi:hypothetical protein